jgi:hypothetical protein
VSAPLLPMDSPCPILLLCSPGLGITVSGRELGRSGSSSTWFELAVPVLHGLFQKFIDVFRFGGRRGSPAPLESKVVMGSPLGGFTPMRCSTK